MTHPSSDGETETTRAAAWLKVEHCSATTTSKCSQRVVSPLKSQDLKLNRGNFLGMDAPMHNRGINDAHCTPREVSTDDAEAKTFL